MGTVPYLLLDVGGSDEVKGVADSRHQDAGQRTEGQQALPLRQFPALSQLDLKTRGNHKEKRRDHTIEKHYIERKNQNQSHHKV